MLRSFMHNNHSIAVAMIIVLYPRWPLEYVMCCYNNCHCYLRCSECHVFPRNGCINIDTNDRLTPPRTHAQHGVISIVTPLGVLQHMEY